MLSSRLSALFSASNSCFEAHMWCFVVFFISHQLLYLIVLRYYNFFITHMYMYSRIIIVIDN